MNHDLPPPKKLSTPLMNGTEATLQALSEMTQTATNTNKTLASCCDSITSVANTAETGLTDVIAQMEKLKEQMIQAGQSVQILTKEIHSLHQAVVSVKTTADENSKSIQTLFNQSQEMMKENYTEKSKLQTYATWTIFYLLLLNTLLLIYQQPTVILVLFLILLSPALCVIVWVVASYPYPTTKKT